MLKNEMMKWMKDLFPICRSITGQGNRETHQYFEKLNPEFERISFKSGEKVFDWTVPNEWNIKDAYIEHESGQRFAEFKKHNLHIVGYSIPQNCTMSREELLPHIYSLPEQPEWIPYVTSYYKEHWGFCMCHNEKVGLPEGNYKVVIDSDLSPGQLDLSHALIKGKSKKEIFFSSYVCHPSMANNELSGPVLLNAILKFVKNDISTLKYSYRFALVAETIGSIAYLSRYVKLLKKNMLCGFNLSCVGDERAYSHLQSPKGDNIADKALSASLQKLDNTVIYSFLDRGSDERQYCAPGIDLPMCGYSRTLFRNYPEYHTSADNFDVVTEEGLGGSLEVMINIIMAFELGLFPKTIVLGEPQLGKRGLFPNISIKGGASDALKLRCNFLAYADGKNSIFDITRILQQPLNKVVEEYKVLKNAGIVLDSTKYF